MYASGKFRDKRSERHLILESAVFAATTDSAAFRFLTPMTDELIVLVEDNEDDVFFMRRALKGAGITSRMQVLTDGQQAADYLTGAGAFANRKQFPLPGVVFLDLKLPYCTGFEVMEAMRKKGTFDEMPIVILTSSPEERDRRQAEEMGAVAYLVKPPTPAVLQELFAALEKIRPRSTQAIAKSNH